MQCLIYMLSVYVIAEIRVELFHNYGIPLQGDPIAEDTRIEFQVYDWSLNSTKNPKNTKE